MRLDSTRQRIAAGSDKQKSNYSASNCCNFHGSIADPLPHTILTPSLLNFGTPPLARAATAAAVPLCPGPPVVVLDITG